MKKIIAILVIATLFVACNNNAEAPAAAVDSVKVDSLEVVDSAVLNADPVPAVLDSVSVK